MLSMNASHEIDLHKPENVVSEDLTQKVRQEFAACESVLQKQLGAQAYQDLYDKVLIDPTRMPTLYDLIGQAAAESGIEAPVAYVYKGSATTRTDGKILGDGLLCNIGVFQPSLTAKPYLAIGIEVLTHPTYALTYQELHAILLHEYGHIKQDYFNKTSKIEKYKYGTNLVTSATVLSLLVTYGSRLGKSLGIDDAQYYWFMTKYRLIGYGIYAGVGHAVNFLLTMGQKACNRRFEYEADAMAIKIGQDANSLISGIEKIERLAERQESLLAQALKKWATLFKTHPLTSDREKALKEMTEAA